MDTDKMRKLQQLYVDEVLHKDIKGLARLRQQDIKVVVTNLFKSEFKTDHFFNYCKEMHGKYIEEKRAFAFKEDPLDFDGYCAENLEYLKDEFHNSL